jgi:hypothetical protein
VKKHTLLLLIIAFLIAACNADPVEEDPTLPPRPTPTVEEATTPEPGDGYPAVEPTAPAAGYPAESAETWVIRPAGEQCADSLSYPSSESAVADLEEAGLEILAVEETELLVCEACGCPTSAHFRVLLSGDDVSTAISLGWQQEP